MKSCLTMPLLFKNVSCCLVERPACGHAKAFGFSYFCLHPEHERFRSHAAGSLTRDEIADRYESLKQKRREAFLATLSDEQRNYFCCRTDFHGRPVADTGRDELS